MYTAMNSVNFEFIHRSDHNNMQLYSYHLCDLKEMDSFNLAPIIVFIIIIPTLDLTIIPLKASQPSLAHTVDFRWAYIK